MGLEVKMSVSEKSASAVYIYDCTGNYASDNTGGFGAPNPKITDVQTVTLRVKAPGKTEYVDIDLSGDFPNVDEVPYMLSPQAAGLSTSYFPSGKYLFKLEYEVLVKGVLKVKTAYNVEVLIKDIECCLDPKTKLVNENLHADEAQQQIVILSNLLEIVKGKIEQGLYDSADKDIEYLNGQCKCATC